MHRRIAFLSLLLSLLAVLPAAAAPLAHHYQTRVVDSGELRNTAESGSAVLFEETIEVEGATWLRLYFDRATLSLPDGADLEAQSKGAQLRLTSVEDGAVQVLDRATLERWNYSSAFFNGDAVRVELVAEAGAPVSRVRVFELMVGEPEGPEESICGATDDRVLANDARVGRIVPVGCTAWFFDDAEGCLLTAGHCIGDSTDVLEFNVPLSTAGGAIRHPGPEDQYPIDLSSIQFTPTTSIGNDWAYFGAFPNGVTGMTPAEAQGGVQFVLATPPLAPGGEDIRITGFGSVTGTQGTPLDWNQVQTTHVGPLTDVSGTILRYATDTTGGDSGSAVHVEGGNTAIGIHTNAGCSAGGGANQATSLANAGLQDALANPIGICLDGPPPLRVLLVDPLPSPLPPAGATIEIDIVDRDDQPALINSATLIYDSGSGDQPVAFLAQGGGRWSASLPSLECGETITMRVDVESTGGTTVHLPFTAMNAADRRYRRAVATDHDRSFYDDAETDMGWNVTNDGGLTAGAWERGFTAGYGMRNDPPWDADGSGQAFLTDPHGGNTDVDGGSTTLTSPVLDATQGADPHITYWRWYSDEGSANLDDSFVVELSNDDGGSWTQLESIGPNVIGEWVQQTFRISTILPPTDQMRIRFIASDAGGPGVVEAGIDGVGLIHGPEGLLCADLFADGFELGTVGAWSSSTP